ncbi:MAG: ABC transporter ATP-binding protein [bacterium]|nr:ABC transporter ATP-binding protein [bacterium]
MITLDNLTRRFGATTAVDALTATIPAGAITALLGPNGAGKTTTLNLLTTLLEPSDGTATVAGCDLRTDGAGVRRAIGYVPEHGTVYEGLTADEYLELAGRIRGLTSAEITARATPLLERFEVAEARGNRLGTFSKGMRRKVLVTAALLHRPPVLLLDEPMDGLDVRSQKTLADLLLELAAGGACIVYSSHILQQVEEVVSRVLLVHQGRLRWDGSLGDLRATHEGAGLRDIFLELTGGGAEA